MSNAGTPQRLVKRRNAQTNEDTVSDGVACLQGLRWCSCQTTRLSSLRFRVRSLVTWIRIQSSCEMSIVNALPRVVGLRFPPTGNADRLGCGDPALVNRMTCGFPSFPQAALSRWGICRCLEPSFYLVVNK